MPGVQLYISDFKRSLTDKLAKDFFSEPSQVRSSFKWCPILPVYGKQRPLARPAACLRQHIIMSQCCAATQASVTCAATGPISVPDLSRIRGSEGQEVFSERKGLSLFKNKVPTSQCAAQAPKGRMHA